MYNQTPRMGVPLKSQTPADIGPTTYIICDGRDRLKNVTPFFTSEKRHPTFFDKSFCDTFYTIPETRTITGGTSPRYRSQRFDFNRYCSPGPGDYELDVKRHKRPPGRGKLYVCKVPLTVKGKGPSIPTKVNENGYSIDKDGNPVANPPNQYDTTLGPAFYTIEHPRIKRCNCRGGNWSKSKSKRGFYEQNDNPGPADYEIKLPKCMREIENEEFREMARRISFVPRYLDALQAKLKREKLPGPADYVIPDKNICKICDSVNSRPFINASKRFKDIETQGPGPGTYTYKPIKYRVAKKCIPAPFSTDAPRFSKKKIDITPGPGEYDVKSPIAEKLLYKKKFFSFNAPFSSSAVRDTLPEIKNAGDTPSPADYTTINKNRCKILVSSVFKSKTKRFPVDCQKVNAPSPLHYDMIDSFNKTKSQKSFNIYNIPFCSLDKKRGIMDTLDISKPGPTDYDCGSKEDTPCRGFVIPTSQRFSEPCECIPGPGAYSIPSTAMTKAYFTHNLKIKENVLRKKLKKHPRETWPRWAADLKKQRKLKYFVGVD